MSAALCNDLRGADGYKIFSCRVGVDPCRVEVRFQNLTVQVQVQAGSQALPSVAKSYTAFLEVTLFVLSRVSTEGSLFVANYQVHIPSHTERLMKHICFAQGGLQKLKLQKPSTSNLTILEDVSGVLLPGRFTLLLGPPGSGKSVLLKSLAGKLQKTALKVIISATAALLVRRCTQHC